MKVSELIQTLWPRTQWPCPVCSKRSLCRCPIADDTDLEQTVMDVAVAKWNERLEPPLIIEAVKLGATALDDGEGAWSRSDLGHLLNDALAECRRVMMKRATERFAKPQGTGELVFMRPQSLPPCPRCSTPMLCRCRVDEPVTELVDVIYTRYPDVSTGDLIDPLAAAQSAVQAQPKRKWTREELGRLCDDIVHEVLPTAQARQTAFALVVEENGAMVSLPFRDARAEIPRAGASKRQKAARPPTAPGS